MFFFDLTNLDRMVANLVKNLADLASPYFFEVQDHSFKSFIATNIQHILPSAKALNQASAEIQVSKT